MRMAAYREDDIGQRARKVRCSALIGHSLLLSQAAGVGPNSVIAEDRAESPRRVESGNPLQAVRKWHLPID